MIVQVDDIIVCIAYILIGLHTTLFSGHMFLGFGLSNSLHTCFACVRMKGPRIDVNMSRIIWVIAVYLWEMFKTS